MTWSPWPHQERAFDWLQASVRSGHRAPLLVSPTGSGKTVISGMVARGTVNKGGRVAFFAHRSELLSQAAKTFREKFDLDTGADGLNASAPVQLLSVQTAISRGEVPPGDVVIFDECHHYASDEWSRLLTAYPNAIKIGLTATPERGDGRALTGFDDIYTVATIKELTALGLLAPLEVLKPAGVVSSKKIAQLPHEAWLEHAKGRPAIVFAPHVKAAKEYAEGFANAGVRCAAIWGDMPGELRAETLAAFDAGKIEVLTSVAVLTEGFDSPRAEVCIIARKVGSLSLYVQMVGRVLRKFSGKAGALLLDLSGVVDIHGPPDQDLEYSLEGDGMRRKGPVLGPRMCRVCGAIVDGDGPCADCGTAAAELVTPGSQGIKLEKFAWIRKQPEGKRVQYLARWIGEAMTTRNKDGSQRSPMTARYKFKGVFGQMPDADTWGTAYAIARMDRGR